MKRPLAQGRYGVGYTFFSSQETERHPRDTKTNADWHLVSLYAGWRVSNFFVTPQLNVGQGDFKTRRTFTAGPVGRQATGDFSGYLASGGFTTGYVIDLGGFQLIPQLALDSMYLHEAAYSESGGGGLGVSLKSQSQKSLRTFAGVMGQGSYGWQDGNLQPQLLVGWSHEFSNDPATIDGSFESAPGSPFHLVGPTLASDKLISGASLSYIFGNWSAGLNYDSTQSSGGVASSATISLSSRF